MKANFDRLQAIIADVNRIEDALQALRDNVDAPTKQPINEAIRGAHGLRDRLWAIDKALEAEAAKA